jgi:hypothetical protein
MASLERRNMVRDNNRAAARPTGADFAAFSAAFFLAGKGRASQAGAAVKAGKEQTAMVAAPGRVKRVVVDTEILEILIELDAGQKLPESLRVDSFIIAGDLSLATSIRNERTN